MKKLPNSRARAELARNCDVPSVLERTYALLAAGDRRREDAGAFPVDTKEIVHEQICKASLSCAALTALPASTLLAQTTYDQRHSVNDRRGDEQSRIRQGEASGQITRRGAHNLEAHQHAIHSQERADRAAANGGRLTTQERHQLARKQNRQSQRIYKGQAQRRHTARRLPAVRRHGLPDVRVMCDRMPAVKERSRERALFVLVCRLTMAAQQSAF